MIGVVWLRNGRVCTSAGPRARAPGRRAPSVGPSTLPSSVTLANVVFVACRAPGSSCSDTRRFASWAANALNTLLDESTSAARSSLLAPSACESRRKLWIERRMLRSRTASAPLSLAV